MLQKLTAYISRKKDEWKSDFFKEPQQKWYFLPLAVLSIVTIFLSVYDYPADPNIKDVSFVLVGVFGGVTGLLGFVAELWPKSQTQLAGILRMWAVLFATCVIGAMSLKFLPVS